MLFNSLEYVIFLPLVVGLYYLLPKNYRWVLLLFASYFFYMCWNASYALLIGISTVVTFSSGIFISRENNRLDDGLIDEKECKKNKRIYVGISFFINLGILAFFKYSPMVLETVSNISGFLGGNINVPNFSYLLPVGISFYTFQALSYTVDVYRGDIKASKNIGKYALFVSFFPQLVAGPIERSTHLLPQFDKAHKFDLRRARKAFLLILWGLFKKVVIANRVAIAVDYVYSDVAASNPATIMIATFLFAFQIYCDFSAYSDIAIGSANLMGFDIMKNFNRPYFSKSISEFWKRWHISLSTWFRDYLYIPLGGSRVKKTRWMLNIMVVFLCSGLWHGAQWTFVLWGAIHGILLVLEGLFAHKYNEFIANKNINKNNFFFKVTSVALTFIIVCVTWTVFRANSIGDLIYIIKNTPTISLSMFKLEAILIGLNSSMNDLVLMVISIVFLVLVQLFQRKKSVGDFLEEKHWIVRWAVYYVLIFGVILLGYYGVGEAAFIYFQF